MSEEISKYDFVERERSAWNDVSKRMDFLLELVSAKADKTIIKDANSKMITSIAKHRLLLTQRTQIELTK